MRDALLLSLRMHVSWFTEAISSRGRSLGPLGGRRLLVLFLLFPLYLFLQFSHWLGLFIDELIFRSYKNVKVKEPLFISGIPSSGSLFIHRTLEQDSSQFTTFRQWEAILAPSIVQRRVIRLISRIDRIVGGPLHWTLDQVLRKTIGPAAGLNKEGLYSCAQDSLCLIPAGGFFLMMAAFPASPSIWQLGRFQEIPEDQRKTLVTYYRKCIQKHLYEAPAGTRLLSRNPAFASWIPDLRFAFPDARYLICVREPRAALAVNLKALRPALSFCGTLSAANTVSLEFQTALAHSYRILLEEKSSFLVDHMAVVDHASLEEHAHSAILDTLRQLTVPLTSQLLQAVENSDPQSGLQNTRRDAAPLATKSGPMEFGSMVGGLYRELLERPHMAVR